MFSKYFGDSPPPCKNKCDVCKNKDEVRAKIAQFEMCQTRSKKSRSNMGSVMQMGYSDDEMYVNNYSIYIRNKYIFALCNSASIIYNYTIIGIHLMSRKNQERK